MQKKINILGINKLFFIFLGYVLSLNLSFADGGILGNFKGTGTLAAKETEIALKNGDIHIEDIPSIINGAIDFFMTIAGTISIIFIIVGAYKILFGSLEQDKTKGKDTIIMALGGFAIASLAWLIIKFIISNLSS